MNHNILNKIYHKRWLEGLKQVNREYHQNYIMYDYREYYDGYRYRPCLVYYPYVYHGLDLSDKSGFTFLHQYTEEYHKFRLKMYLLNRDRKGDWGGWVDNSLEESHNGMSYVRLLHNIYDLCSIKEQDYSYLLPKRYKYSSGLNYSKGYKDF